MTALSEGAGSGAFAVAGGGTSRYGPEKSQFVRVLLPPGAGVHPTVFIVHGGFWKNKYTVANGATETLAPWLVRRGYAVVEVEYRRRDSEGGGWPGTVDDATRAVDHALEAFASSLDASNFAVVGHSAGGHAALFAAARCVRPPRLVVAVAPVADMVAAYERQLSDEGDAALRFMKAPLEEARDAYVAACPTRSALCTLLSRAPPRRRRSEGGALGREYSLPRAQARTSSWSRGPSTRTSRPTSLGRSSKRRLRLSRRRTAASTTSSSRAPTTTCP